MVGVRTTGPPEHVADEIAHVGRGRLRRRHDRSLRRARRGRVGRPPRAARRDEPHPSAPEVVATETFLYLELWKQLYDWGAGVAASEEEGRTREHDATRRPARGRRQGIRRHARGRRHLARDPARLVLRPARAVGLRQDDDAPDDRRLRGADVAAGSSSATATSSACRRTSATSTPSSRATRSSRT